MQSKEDHQQAAQFGRLETVLAHPCAHRTWAFAVRDAQVPPEAGCRKRPARRVCDFDVANTMAGPGRP